jgi:hypothetical protein
VFTKNAVKAKLFCITLKVMLSKLSVSGSVFVYRLMESGAGGHGMGASLCVRVRMEFKYWKHNEDILYTSSFFIAVHSTKYSLYGENEQKKPGKDKKF